MGHVKSFMKDIVMETVRIFFFGAEVLSFNFLLDSIFFTSSGPRIPVVNASLFG